MGLFEKKKSQGHEPANTGERFHFKLNQRIKMAFSSAGGRVTYMSSVQDVFEHAFRVYLPSSGGVPVEMPAGTKVEATLFDATGMYDFDSTVVGTNVMGIAWLELAKPERVTRSQKRKNIRARTALRAVYQVATSSRSMLDASIPDSGHVTARDISEGGVCLEMPHKLVVGVVADVRVQLPVRAVNAVGEIVRVNKDQYSDKFFTGILFRQISDNDRQLIREFVESIEHNK